VIGIDIVAGRTNPAATVAHPINPRYESVTKPIAEN